MSNALQDYLAASRPNTVKACHDRAGLARPEQYCILGVLIFVRSSINLVETVVSD